MAHLGRLYPLNVHRYINSDVDYPYWAAARYKAIIPFGTGALAASLINRNFSCDPLPLDPPWVQWQGTSIDVSLNILYILTIKIALTNDPGFPSAQRFKLDYIQGLPPSAGTLTEWESDFPPGAQLDTLLGIAATNHFPLIWQTIGVLPATAVPW